MHRRAGTQADAECTMDPGSAAHRHSASKTRVNALMAPRSIRGTLPHPEERSLARISFGQTAHLTLERLVDGALGFVLYLPQMGLAAKTLGIDLVDVFGAGRPRGKPSAIGNDLDPAERLTVAGRGRERRANRLAGQFPPRGVFARKRPAHTSPC